LVRYPGVKPRKHIAIKCRHCWVVLTRRETFIKTQPGETPNDRNDRAIRVAAAWYTQRIPAMRIVLLSNDVDNRRKAAEAGITTMSVQVT
jgi:PIN domain